MSPNICQNFYLQYIKNLKFNKTNFQDLEIEALNVPPISARPVVSREMQTQCLPTSATELQSVATATAGELAQASGVWMLQPWESTGPRLRTASPPAFPMPSGSSTRLSKEVNVYALGLASSVSVGEMLT